MRMKKVGQRRPVRALVAIVFALTVAASALPVAAATPVVPREDCLPPSGSPWLDEGPTKQGLLASAGTTRGIVLFADFSDAPARNQSAQDLYDLIGPPSAAAISTSSYGRAELSLTPYPTWLRLPAPSTDYGFDRLSFSFAKFRSFMADAMTLADPSVDFSLYDVIYVVASKGAQVDGVAFIASNEQDGITLDGKNHRFGVTIGQRDGREPVVYPDLGSPVLVHETAHLWGLPDLYNNVSPFFDDAGAWDLMSQPEPMTPDLLAWHKWKLGWLDDAQVSCQVGAGELNVTLSPVGAPGGTKLAIVRTGPSTVLTIEVRQPVGLDADLCDSGVLITKVDTSVITGADPGAVDVQSAQPDEAKDIARCGYLYNAPYDLATDEVPSYSSGDLSVRLWEKVGQDYTMAITYSGSYKPPVESHAVVVALRFAKHLVTKGTVAVEDAYSECVAGAVIQIERKKAGLWKPVTTTVASDAGTFKLKIADKPGTYRATVASSSPSMTNLCAAAISSEIKHRHR